MSHLRRRAAETSAARVAVVAVAASLFLPSCSGDDEAGSPQPQETTSSETSPTESEPSPTPTIQPATGPVLMPNTGGITVRLPAGWKVDHADSFLVDGSPEQYHRTLITVNSFPSLDSNLSLARLTRLSREHSPFPPGSIRPQVWIAGRLAYHLAGKGEFPRLEQYGTIVDGDMLYVRFYLDDYPRAKRQALIDSVLATVEWG
jgi:hypothetical protein